MPITDKLNEINNEIRVCDTAGLKALAHKAESLDFNRQVTPTFLANLDPDGSHVLYRAVAGMDDATLDRVKVLSKFTGKNDPIEVYLDVLTEDFNALMTMAEALGID